MVDWCMPELWITQATNRTATSEKQENNVYKYIEMESFWLSKFRSIVLFYFNSLKKNMKIGIETLLTL